MNTLQAALVTALSFIILVALAMQGPVAYSELENRAKVEFVFVKQWLDESYLYEIKRNVASVRDLGKVKTTEYVNLSTRPEKLLQLIDLLRDLAARYGEK